ncbi:hypothetical protein [Streptomyces sp. DB-54]
MVRSRPNTASWWPTPKDQASVGAALSQAVRESEALLLVYYCGHGLLAEAGLLHFALTGTDTENVSFSAIHLDLVKRMVGGARAKARVLVLDCCFSGQAGRSSRLTSLVDAHPAPPLDTVRAAHKVFVQDTLLGAVAFGVGAAGPRIGD